MQVLLIVLIARFHIICLTHKQEFTIKHIVELDKISPYLPDLVWTMTYPRPLGPDVVWDLENVEFS